MAKNVARLAIAARGVALMALIAASENGYLFLTKDEAGDLVTAGQAEVMTAVPSEDPTLAAVALTDAGKAALAASGQGASEAAAGAVASAAGGYELDDDVPMPAGGRSAGRESKYPIDTMEKGQSFHIPATAAMPDPASAIASTLTTARAKFAVPVNDDAGQPIIEAYKKPIYERGEDGKSYVKGEDGKRVITGYEDATKAKVELVRDWKVKAVNDDDPRGKGARVWRVK